MAGRFVAPVYSPVCETDSVRYAEYLKVVSEYLRAVILDRYVEACGGGSPGCGSACVSADAALSWAVGGGGFPEVGSDGGAAAARVVGEGSSAGATGVCVGEGEGSDVSGCSDGVGGAAVDGGVLSDGSSSDAVAGGGGVGKVGVLRESAGDACSGSTSGLGQESVKFGVHHARNVRRRARKRENKKKGFPDSSAVPSAPTRIEGSSDLADVDVELKKSLALRRKVENELAAERAALQLRLAKDPAIQQMRVEAARYKVVGNVSAVAAKAHKSFEAMGSVSPSSSASMVEVKQLREELDEARFRASLLEEKCGREDVKEVNKISPPPDIAADYYGRNVCDPAALAQQIHAKFPQYMTTGPVDQTFLTARDVYVHG